MGKLHFGMLAEELKTLVVLIISATTPAVVVM